MTTCAGPNPSMRQAAASGSRTDRPVTERLREQAHEVTRDLQEMGNIAGDAVEENLQHLRENASEYCEHGRDGVHKVERSFEQFIRDQPLKSILIAGGVGLLLGRFWLRR